MQSYHITRERMALSPWGSGLQQVHPGSHQVAGEDPDREALPGEQPKACVQWQHRAVHLPCLCSKCRNQALMFVFYQS